jgi:hypothetical protein
MNTIITMEYGIVKTFNGLDLSRNLTDMHAITIRLGELILF